MLMFWSKQSTVFPSNDCHVADWRVVLGFRIGEVTCREGRGRGRGVSEVCLSSQAQALARMSKSEYIITDTGNKVSRRCTTCGPQNIVLGGKTIIQSGVIIRGDLRRAGGTGAAVMVAVGKYSSIGEGTVIRPPAKTFKG